METAETEKPRPSQTWKLVSEMTASEARAYFLRQTSYTTIELPQYFDFETVLQRVASVMPADQNPGWSEEARRSADVNYVLHDNKDGRLAWRPLALIHPALYVSLVHTMTRDQNWGIITTRLQEFRDLPRFHCASMPRVRETSAPSKVANDVEDSGAGVFDGPFGAAMSMAWFNEVEQASMEMSLDFNVMLQADIANCYSSIYTHTIPWALHDRGIAKKQRKRDASVGNLIDGAIKDMMEGQTNGIPQGSELMNFIAEIVLGYGDLILSQNLEDSNVVNYRVIRYRDDYRIFTENRADAERALKCLYEALRSVGLELRLDKTQISEDIIGAAVRADKVAWIRGDYQRRITASNDTPYNLLLQLRDFNGKYPNSGRLKQAIVALREHRSKYPDQWRLQLMPLVGLLTNIGLSNPKVYPLLALFLGELITEHDDHNQRQRAVESIMKRVINAPQTGRIDLSLQRIKAFRDHPEGFGEHLCRLVMEPKGATVWDSSWLQNQLRLRKAVETSDLIDRDQLQGMPDLPTEIELQRLAWTTLSYE